MENDDMFYEHYMATLSNMTLSSDSRTQDDYDKVNLENEKRFKYNKGDIFISKKEDQGYLEKFKILARRNGYPDCFLFTGFWFPLYWSENIITGEKEEISETYIEKITP